MIIDSKTNLKIFDKNNAAMSIKIGNDTFEGPFNYSSSLKSQSGVYAVLCGTSHRVIDIGESENVRDRVEKHDRKSCWKDKCSSTISYAVLYCGEQERMRIERELRRLLGNENLCGNR